MGYLVIQTENDGQTIIDASKVINIALDPSGEHLDFIMELVDGAEGVTDKIRLLPVTANAFDEDTLEQFNRATIDAIGNAFVNVLPLTGQEAKGILYNPGSAPTGAAIRDSYSGTFVNFGHTGSLADVLGGDTVNWGTVTAAAVDHLGNLVVMNDSKVAKISVKWSSSVPIRGIMGSAVVSFKFSKCTNIMADVSDAANWTTVGTATTQWRASDGEDFPGFLEVKSADNINYAAGDLLAFTASSSTGFSNTGEEVEVGLILEGL
jgi:hypothetical protein